MQYKCSPPSFVTHEIVMTFRKMTYIAAIIILFASCAWTLKVTRSKNADVFSKKLNEGCGQYTAIWKHDSSCECQIHKKTLTSSFSSKEKIRCQGNKNIPMLLLENNTNSEIDEKCHNVTQSYIWNTYLSEYGVWEERSGDMSRLLSIQQSGEGRSVLQFQNIKKLSGHLLNISMACVSRKGHRYTKVVFVKFIGTVKYPFNMADLFTKASTTSITNNSTTHQTVTTPSERTKTYITTSTRPTTTNVKTTTTTATTTTTTETTTTETKTAATTTITTSKKSSSTFKSTTEEQLTTLTTNRPPITSSTSFSETQMKNRPTQKTTTRQTFVATTDNSNRNILTISLAAGLGVVSLTLLVIAFISCLSRRKKQKRYPELKDNPSYSQQNETADGNDVYLVPVDSLGSNAANKTDFCMSSPSDGIGCHDLNNPSYRDVECGSLSGGVNDDDVQTYATIEVSQQPNNIYTGLTRNRSVHSTSSLTCPLMNEPSTHASLLHHVNSTLTSVQENYETVQDLRDPNIKNMTPLPMHDGIQNNSHYNESDWLSKTNTYAVLEPDLEASAEHVYNILEEDDAVFLSRAKRHNLIKQESHTEDEKVAHQSIYTGVDNVGYESSGHTNSPAADTDVSPSKDWYETVDSLDVENETNDNENMYRILEPS